MPVGNVMWVRIVIFRIFALKILTEFVSANCSEQYQ